MSCGTDFGAVEAGHPANVDMFRLNVAYEAVFVPGGVLTLSTLPAKVSAGHQLHNTSLNIRWQLWKYQYYCIVKIIQLLFMVSRVVDSEGISGWTELVTEATLVTWAGHVSGLDVPGDAGPVFGGEVTLCTLKLTTTVFVDA